MIFQKMNPIIRTQHIYIDKSTKMIAKCSAYLARQMNFANTYNICQKPTTGGLSA